jgi:carbon-monoxide dehydrogenase medium subunit
MKSRHAAYHRPTTVEAAVALLTASENAVILAGGQSLVAALNLRLNAPDAIIDINWIPGLDRIEETADAVVIGALVRHDQTANSPLVAQHLPLIARAMAHVAHPAIRNRGTTCGSLAYADPAAEMPACAVALDATLVLRGRNGAREIRARKFYLGLYETERQPDEILTEIRIPKRRSQALAGFGEIARRHGDFASVGIAARAEMTGDRIAALDMVAFASEPAPRLCADAAKEAAGQAWSTALIDRLAEALVAEIEPMETPHGGPDVKRRQARALARRVLTDMREQFHAR